jgi:hypothetical protein
VYAPYPHPSTYLQERDRSIQDGGEYFAFKVLRQED